MNVKELILEAYRKVTEGDMKRIDLTTAKGVAVKAYWVGPIIRIDIKGLK